MNGRLRHIESIAKRFGELTMAHRGEVKATVTSVIVSFIFLPLDFMFLCFCFFISVVFSVFLSEREVSVWHADEMLPVRKLGLGS